MDENFFPDRSSELICQIVNLIHHYRAEIGEGRRVGIEHVAKYLCRHHQYIGIGVDVGISG